LTARGFAFRVVVHSPLDHQVELVATGLVGHRGAEGQLAAHGRRARSRALAMARGTRRRGPIHARIVLAIWLGMDDDIDVARVGFAASRAVEEAVSRGADRIGFAPGLIDGSPRVLLE
jgi:hypothetical protein